MIDRERMRALAAAQGVALSDLQLEQLDRYADTLVEANQKMNLTAIVDRQGIEEKHFLDSLLLVPLLPEGCKSLIDVGTGAGFPGVVAKVALPGLRLTLLDSLQKRVTFLEELCAHLGFGGVTCLHGRAEESGRDPALREQFDVATARAVADLVVLAEYCLPLSLIHIFPFPPFEKKRKGRGTALVICRHNPYNKKWIARNSLSVPLCAK